MNLLVDLGNSRLKWAQASRGGWVPGVADRRAADGLGVRLDEVWGRRRAPQRVLACSVAGSAVNAELSEWVARNWSLTVEFVRTTAAGYGVRNGYRDPAQLGVDRWVALIAARGLTPEAAAVVDCGTAVTIDALTGDGEFLGGVILPGVELCREMLLARTAGIREGEAEHVSATARSTGEAVLGGAVFGIAGAVERIVAEFETVLGPRIAVLVTGGSAGLILPRVRRQARHEPELVLRGLSRMLGEDAAARAPAAGASP